MRNINLYEFIKLINSTLYPKKSLDRHRIPASPYFENLLDLKKRIQKLITYTKKELWDVNAIYLDANSTSNESSFSSDGRSSSVSSSVSSSSFSGEGSSMSESSSSSESDSADLISQSSEDNSSTSISSIEAHRALLEKIYHHSYNVLNKMLLDIIKLIRTSREGGSASYQACLYALKDDLGHYLKHLMPIAFSESSGYQHAFQGQPYKLSDAMGILYVPVTQRFDPLMGGYLDKNEKWHGNRGQCFGKIVSWADEIAKKGSPRYPMYVMPAEGLYQENYDAVQREIETKGSKRKFDHIFKLIDSLESTVLQYKIYDTHIQSKDSGHAIGVRLRNDGVIEIADSNFMNLFAVDMMHAKLLYCSILSYYYCRHNMIFGKLEEVSLVQNPKHTQYFPSRQRITKSLLMNSGEHSDKSLVDYFASIGDALLSNMKRRKNKQNKMDIICLKTNLQCVLPLITSPDSVLDLKFLLRKICDGLLCTPPERKILFSLLKSRFKMVSSPKFKQNLKQKNALLSVMRKTQEKLDSERAALRVECSDDKTKDLGKDAVRARRMRRLQTKITQQHQDVRALVILDSSDCQKQLARHQSAIANLVGARGDTANDLVDVSIDLHRNIMTDSSLVDASVVWKPSQVKLIFLYDVVDKLEKIFDSDILQLNSSDSENENDRAKIFEALKQLKLNELQRLKVDIELLITNFHLKSSCESEIYLLRERIFACVPLDDDAVEYLRQSPIGSISKQYLHILSSAIEALITDPQIESISTLSGSQIDLMRQIRVLREKCEILTKVLCSLRDEYVTAYQKKSKAVRKLKLESKHAPKPLGISISSTKKIFAISVMKLRMQQLAQACQVRLAMLQEAQQQLSATGPEEMSREYIISIMIKLSLHFSDILPRLSTEMMHAPIFQPIVRKALKLPLIEEVKISKNEQNLVNCWVKREVRLLTVREKLDRALRRLDEKCQKLAPETSFSDMVRRAHLLALLKTIETLKSMTEESLMSSAAEILMGKDYFDETNANIDNRVPLGLILSEDIVTSTRFLAEPCVASLLVQSLQSQELPVNMKRHLQYLFEHDMLMQLAKSDKKAYKDHSQNLLVPPCVLEVFSKKVRAELIDLQIQSVSDRAISTVKGIAVGMSHAIWGGAETKEQRYQRKCQESVEEAFELHNIALKGALLTQIDKILVALLSSENSIIDCAENISHEMNCSTLQKYYIISELIIKHKIQVQKLIAYKRICQGESALSCASVLRLLEDLNELAPGLIRNGISLTDNVMNKFKEAKMAQASSLAKSLRDKNTVDAVAGYKLPRYSQRGCLADYLDQCKRDIAFDYLSMGIHHLQEHSCEALDRALQGFKDVRQAIESGQIESAKEVYYELTKTTVGEAEALLLPLQTLILQNTMPAMSSEKIRDCVSEIVAKMAPSSHAVVP